MSEYQRIAFRAIDGPVSEKNLEYMRQQSSRAEITGWAFDNEYQYGDFGGDALQMLRRGYDLHLHYANFGIRKLLIRLPDGLPDSEAAKPYLGKHLVQFLRDKGGRGGTLAVEPFHEPGDLEEPYDLDGLLDRLLPLRAEILDGDLRPLYLGHLAMACDGNHDPDKTKEAPVPAGLETLSDAQSALAEFYGLSDSLIAAAAQGAPVLTERLDPRTMYAQWLHGQPQTIKDGWLAQYLADPHAGVRREMLAEFRRTTGTPGWPTVRLDRTIAALEASTDAIQQQQERLAADKAAARRVKKLAAMVANPAETLRETEKLVEQRSSHAYEQIATLLTDLREALAGSEQAGLAERQAQKLKKDNPTLNRLTGALRGRGLLAR